MKKVGIVGANGFISKHLISALSEEKDIELLLYGRGENTGKYAFPYNTINFNDSDALLRDFKDVDVVYYMVSETIPATSWNSPHREIEKNLIPFINLLEVLCQTRTRKIAFVSSAGTVYGSTTGKVSEDHDKKPFSPYGITKLTMENFLSYYKARHGIQYDIYRVSNVYGEGQNTSKGLGIINTFLEKILKEGAVNVFGDGKTTRNYIYVKDVAELMKYSVNHLSTSEVFNLSSDSTLSINELIEVIRKVVQENFEVNYQEVRQSDNSYIDLDNSKIKACFPGFRFIDISEGIKKTYVSLKETVVKN